MTEPNHLRLLFPRTPIRFIGRASLPAFLVLSFLIEPAVAQKVATRAASSSAARVFLLDGKRLEAVRQRIRGGDKSFDPALAELDREAKKALTAGPFSVVSKDGTPSSGDKHDYMSQAPYFWRNPSTPNGLPYVRRDGERNPEINKISDHQNLGRMTSAVETLALAYYFKGDEACATKAARLLRAWFLDPGTRMNPNLQYAQAVPGVSAGRGTGLIETRGLAQAVDAIGLLSGSKAWSETDQHGLEEWFANFLDWMLKSQNGQSEANAKNNHGTYFDVQTASFALFVGKKDLATNTLEAAQQKRIAAQIEPEGRQPLELARTKSWGYSVMNLQGLMELARLGEDVGVDLWSYQTADGHSIRRALEYLVPFALGEKESPNPQLGEWQPLTLSPLIRRAAEHYQDSQYRALMSKIPDVDPTDRSVLLFPRDVKLERARRPQ